MAPDGLPELLADSVFRLERLTRQSDPEALAREEAAARAAFMGVAQSLSEARRKEARLSAAVTEAMQPLRWSVPGSTSPCVRWRAAPAGSRPWSSLVAANASQPLRPMAPGCRRAANFAHRAVIQVITSRNASTPTLIFDEVDGIGGRWLRSSGVCYGAGDDPQIRCGCVTHLPQVAPRQTGSGRLPGDNATVRPCLG